MLEAESASSLKSAKVSANEMQRKGPSSHEGAQATSGSAFVRHCKKVGWPCIASLPSIQSVTPLAAGKQGSALKTFPATPRWLARLESGPTVKSRFFHYCL